MKTTLKVLESTWIYFLVSFYDPTNSHTNFGQKIFTLRWIATVVELGGFDFTSAFTSHLKKLYSMLTFWLEKLNCGFVHLFHSWKKTTKKTKFFFLVIISTRCKNSILNLPSFLMYVDYVFHLAANLIFLIKSLL